MQFNTKYLTLHNTPQQQQKQITNTLSTLTNVHHPHRSYLHPTTHPYLFHANNRYLDACIKHEAEHEELRVGQQPMRASIQLLTSMLACLRHNHESLNAQQLVYMELLAQVYRCGELSMEAQGMHEQAVRLARICFGYHSHRARLSESLRGCCECGCVTKESSCLTPPNAKRCSNALKRCGKCKKVLFCSSQCQRKNWIKHKVECCSV